MSESTYSQLRLRENQVFVLLTVVIGVIAGLSAVLFALGITTLSRVVLGLEPSPLRRFLMPPVLSLIAGALLYWVFPDSRGSGVPQTKTAYHRDNGVIPSRVPFGKFLTGVLCVGSGHSLGREGPCVQIGAGLASRIGIWLQLSPGRVRSLVPVGAAAALSAAFNTPVAAVLFALEEIIGDMNAGLLGSTVVASVASVIVARSVMGNEPLFHVPAYDMVHPAELIAYAVLGVISGLLSVAFSRGLLSARALFLGLPARSRLIQPAIGGLMVGAILALEPRVGGVGYASLDQALNGEMLLGAMLALCALKSVATIMSYSSGNAGGIFAPTLFIGAMAGGAIGSLARMAAPFPTADPGAYALVGMGALFAGIIRAPMTSVFMIFEITQDYHTIVPLMTANLLSLMIARRYQHEGVYHALLRQDGVLLPGAPESP